MVTLSLGYALRKIFTQPRVISSITSAPTRFRSSSGATVSSPGFQLGMDGSTWSWCSGAAYFRANADVAMMLLMAAKQRRVVGAGFLMDAPPGAHRRVAAAVCEAGLNRSA